MRLGRLGATSPIKVLGASGLRLRGDLPVSWRSSGGGRGAWAGPAAPLPRNGTVVPPPPPTTERRAPTGTTLLMRGAPSAPLPGFLNPKPSPSSCSVCARPSHPHPGAHMGGCGLPLQVALPAKGLNAPGDPGLPGGPSPLHPVPQPQRWGWRPRRGLLWEGSPSRLRGAWRHPRRTGPRGACDL